MLAQKLHDFELVVSDDWSTDSTGAVGKECSDRDPRVVFYRHPTNTGAISHFEFVRAHGEIFVWHAATDKCEPGYVNDSRHSLIEPKRVC